MSDLFADLRAREFRRLDAGGHVYLDYTGSGLYPESLVREHAELLAGSVFGNPHSRNPTSLAATEMVERTRERVADFFDADPAEYEVVFTLNASAALKLVGESFPFAPGGRFVLTADNHNSVHGLREFAAARGAEVRYVPLDHGLRIHTIDEHLADADPTADNLFVFPAQSNFSGVKHPLGWVERAQARGFRVFLDAAAYVPTSRLSLASIKPDFVALSFYKMFGFPTGVGVLLARCNALCGLTRPWFGGGTVRFVSAAAPVQLLHTTGRGFEDGTLNFLDIAAVPAGLAFMDRLGMERINEHVMQLTDVLLRELGQLYHSNGMPLVHVYGPQCTEGRGGTVAFNVADTAGEVVDFRAVEERATAAAVSIRTGYFCNPGAAEYAFEHEDAEIGRCARSVPPESFTIHQFSVCMHHKPVGAVRASLGMPSNEADIGRLVEVVASFRDHGPTLPSSLVTAATEAPR